MEDTDFFDMLYQGWSKTTGAESTFWMYEEDVEFYDQGPGTFIVYAVDHEQNRKFVASFERDEDAAFITALHGCFADLVRRLHMALDQAETKDRQRDDTEVELADLSLENAELHRKLKDLETVVDRLDQDNVRVNADLVYWKDIAERASESA